MNSEKTTTTLWFLKKDIKSLLSFKSSIVILIISHFLNSNYNVLLTLFGIRKIYKILIAKIFYVRDKCS